MKKNHTTPRMGMNIECNTHGKVCLDNIFDQKLFPQLQYYSPYHAQYYKPLFFFNVTWLLKYALHVKPNDYLKFILNICLKIKQPRPLCFFC